MTPAQWLKSPRDHTTGLKILKKHNPTLALIIQNPTSYNKTRLTTEIHNIASRYRSSLPLVSDEWSTAKTQKPNPRYRSSPDEWSNSNTLNPQSYPKTLRPAIQRQNNLYKKINHLHPLLDQLYNTHRTKAFHTKIALQKTWREIDQIWRIIHYYRENNVILPNPYHPTDPTPPTDRAQLVNRRNALRSYISRYRDDPAKTLKTQKWKKELQTIETIINTDTAAATARL